MFERDYAPCHSRLLPPYSPVCARTSVLPSNSLPSVFSEYAMSTELPAAFGVPTVPFCPFGPSFSPLFVRIGFRHGGEPPPCPVGQGRTLRALPFPSSPLGSLSLDLFNLRSRWDLASFFSLKNRRMVSLSRPFRVSEERKRYESVSIRSNPVPFLKSRITS